MIENYFEGKQSVFMIHIPAALVGLEPAAVLLQCCYYGLATACPKLKSSLSRAVKAERFSCGCKDIYLPVRGILGRGQGCFLQLVPVNEKRKVLLSHVNVARTSVRKGQGGIISQITR